MVALSMVAAAGPAAIADVDDDTTQTVEALENGEDLYLAFGADLNGQSLDEYVAAHANDAGGDANAQVIQYQDVGQVNLVEEGEAVSVAIGGGEAVAIQEVNQENTNVQAGEATAENYPSDGRETTFENVGDVYLILGNGGDQSFDGWGIADEKGDVRASQTAVAGVTQAQAVGQVNLVQNTTALAIAENESDATAIQFTQQSNLNLQEGSANATNVLAADLGDHEDRHEKHKKGKNGLLADQTAEATVEQVQEIDQVNAYRQGAAVAIAVGQNATATAVQITDQSNLNEQLGTAEAINVLMDSAGMNVAVASMDGATEVLTQDAADVHEPKEKKDGDHDDHDVEQVAEASVVQYQSAEQANINLNSSAVAIASNGGEADAVQLTFQQNVNAQVGSADALNVFLEEDEELPEKKGEDGTVPTPGEDFQGLVLTETTAITVGGDQLADADRTTFDYDGSYDQKNDVEQWSTAEVEQFQEIVQVNYHSNDAFAVADDGGEASAVQLTIQENENLQIAAAESTSVIEGPIGDDEKGHDEAGTDSDDSAVGATVVEADEADRKGDDDGLPGFGVAVALVALLSATALAVRSRR